MIARCICRLFGHAQRRTFYEPWRVVSARADWRTVTDVCSRCGEVVRQWLEASEEAP